MDSESLAVGGSVQYKFNMDMMRLHLISNKKLYDNILKHFHYSICGSHGSANEDCGLLGYEAMLSRRWLGTFPISLLPLFSVYLKMEAAGSYKIMKEI
jgi:hypothetical protein